MSNKEDPLYVYSESDLDKMLEDVVLIVKEAGELIKSAMGTSLVVNKDFNSADGHAAAVLTETDGAVEKQIIQRISSLYPDHKFIGEEGLGADTENQLPMLSYTNKPTWIIDPIDGTMNFIHSNPLVVTSVGLVINKKLVLGIINAPMLGYCYTAVKGKGAFLNGSTRLRTRDVKKLKDAMIIMELSSGARAEKQEKCLSNLKELLNRTHAVRCPGQ